MGFSISGITSGIGNIFKGASSAVKEFGKNAIMKKADPTGGWLSTALSIGSSLMTKKAGSAQAPDLRMKTVDGDTLNAEWEYRLKKGLRDKNLFS